MLGLSAGQLQQTPPIKESAAMRKTGLPRAAEKGEVERLLQRIRPNGRASRKISSRASTGNKSRAILMAPNSTGLREPPNSNTTSRKYWLPWVWRARTWT